MQLKAIETNKGAESHIAGLYTQGPRMIFLTEKKITNGVGYPGRHVHPTWISVKFRFAFKLI